MSTQTKILLVGDGGVGKTSAIDRHFGGHFSTGYIAGDVIQEHVYQKDNHRRIIYDYPGQCRFSFSALTANLDTIDSAVIMYDLTSKMSHRGVKEWTALIKDKFGDVPIKLVGNKADIRDRIVVKTNDDKISAKSKINLECVF